MKEHLLDIKGLHAGVEGKEILKGLSLTVGKGGNPVGFIMEHEQMTYPEALRWLARKYHIEIKERELSDDEKREQSERESMFIVNEWAQSSLRQPHAHHTAVSSIPSLSFLSHNNTNLIYANMPDTTCSRHRNFLKIIGTEGKPYFSLPTVPLFNTLIKNNQSSVQNLQRPIQI